MHTLYTIQLDFLKVKEVFGERTTELAHYLSEQFNPSVIDDVLLNYRRFLGGAISPVYEISGLYSLPSSELASEHV